MYQLIKNTSICGKDLYICTMTKLYHVHYKATGEDRYYNSLSAVFGDNADLGVSKFTLDRYHFNPYFENDICIIKYSLVFSAAEVRAGLPTLARGKYNEIKGTGTRYKELLNYMMAMGSINKKLKDAESDYEYELDIDD